MLFLNRIPFISIDFMKSLQGTKKKHISHRSREPAGFNHSSTQMRAGWEKDLLRVGKF